MDQNNRKSQQEKYDNRWAVYLLQCADGTLYCGCSVNLERRLAEHQTGRGAKYLRGRTPAVLVACRHQLTETQARRLEARVKRQPRRRKREVLETATLSEP